MLLGPVTLFVLLPIGLGLEHYVITGDSMAGDRPGGLARGSVAFERVVPLSDLRIGDVITYERPGAADGDAMVTRRIVEIGPDGIVTQGDAAPTRDPWTVRPDGSTMPRVVLVVPWIGWLYLVRPSGWLYVAAALVLVAFAVQRMRRRTPRLRPAVAPAGAPDAALVKGLNGE